MIRKLLIAIVVFFMMAVPGLCANKFYWATGLIGGGAALDGIDGAGLAAGDTAAVMIDSGTNVPMIYFYRVQASSASEASPNIIVPNSNAGTSAWHMAGIQGGIKIVTDANGMSAAEMLEAGMNGTLFLATGSGTWILPTAVEGMNGCLRDTGTNHDLILDVQAGDDFSLLGVEDTNGDGVTNAATTTTGDMICFVATSAGHWMSMGIVGVWVAQ